MHSMFYMASSFNGQLKHLDVSNVKDFSFMFYGAETFDKDIGTWDVSMATSMVSMFEGAKSCNEDLCVWADKISNKVNLKATNMFAGSDCDITGDPVFVGDGVTGSFCNDDNLMEGLLLKLN